MSLTKLFFDLNLSHKGSCFSKMLLGPAAIPPCVVFQDGEHVTLAGCQ